MKMPTIVGIFILISRDNFMVSWIEHEKCFITSEPGPLLFAYAHKIPFRKARLFIITILQRVKLVVLFSTDNQFLLKFTRNM